MFVTEIIFTANYLEEPSSECFTPAATRRELVMVTLGFSPCPSEEVSVHSSLCLCVYDMSVSGLIFWWIASPAGSTGHSGGQAGACGARAERLGQRAAVTGQASRDGPALEGAHVCLHCPCLPPCPPACCPVILLPAAATTSVTASQCQCWSVGLTFAMHTR